MPDILYEDNHVLVAVKPANVLSQEDRTGDPDMLSILKEYIRVKYQKPGKVYLGLVHRLDRPVGGLMVFARTSKAASRLSRQMQTHEMGREYLCLVHGTVPPRFTLIDYLIKNEQLNKVTVCTGDEKKAQEAILHGVLLFERNGLSLCSIKLDTGRNHQIRVQMSHMGHPIWGDNRYGQGIPGQQIALWGYRLTFEHPITHQVQSFMSLPHGGIWTQFQDVLDGLFQSFLAAREQAISGPAPEKAFQHT
ncbi:MAG: RluA family pseudouridine synthase [Clostridia bacterium]|nr:RluA family pseudouridine synthase [Clostridia bacterium]